MVRKLLNAWIVLVCMFGGWSAFADDVTDIYQIEVVFFEHKDPKRFEAEHWPQSVGKLDTAGAINLNSIKQGVPDSVEVLQTLDALDDLGQKPVQKVIPKTITLVDPQHQVLAKEIQKIKSSKDLRFIQHFAWTQPLIPYGKATPILLQVGNKGDYELEAIVDARLVRTSFDVNIDYIFKTDASNRAGVHEFKVKRDVKLKRREVFYIDHPIVGAIITVVPVYVEY